MAANGGKIKNDITKTSFKKYFNKRKPKYFEVG